MFFQPDIIVQSRNGPEIYLAGEIKSSLNKKNVQAASRQLREYMVGMNCSTGFLISPIRLVLFRDNFYLQGIESIEQIADLNLAGTFLQFERISRTHSSITQVKEREFHKSVFAWLDTLLEDQCGMAASSDLNKYLRDYIIPALEQGELRAAKPAIEILGSDDEYRRRIC